VNLTHELATLIRQARSHGATSVDCYALEQLVGAHEEHLRRDLVRRGDMLVVGLTD
jgi:hypothetical protein